MKPIFPRLIAIFSPLFLLIQYLSATDVQPVQSEAPNVAPADNQLVQSDDDDQDDDEDADYTSEDEWYGPGFYFGIWFGNENDYWGWRNNHRYYRSNRNYYHPSHPVPYNRGSGGGRSGGGGGRGGGGGGGHGR